MNALRENFGIYIIAVWSAVLGGLNLIRLFYTSGMGFSQFEVQATLAQLHIYQWTSLAFSIAFLAAGVGLWQKKNWGRLLFLAVVLLYFTVSIFGVWHADADKLLLQAKGWLMGRYVLSVALPFIYLNLPFVKKAFVKSVAS